MFVRVPGPTLNSGKVTILFGWADGSLKNVSKYAQIYHRLNMDVLVCTSTSLDFFFIPSNRSFSSLKELEIMKELRESHLHIHCFSNGGSLMFKSFLNAWQRQFGSVPDVQRIVLDSMPGATAWTGAFVSSMLIKNILLRLSARYSIWACLWAAQAFKYLYLLGRVPFELCNGAIGVSDYLLDNRLLSACPRLYLYSDADALVPYNQIEWHFSKAHSNGLKVQSHKFIGSAHVSHFRSFPEEYEKLVYDFIDFTKNKL